MNQTGPICQAPGCRKVVSPARQKKSWPLCLTCSEPCHEKRYRSFKPYKPPPSVKRKA